MLCSWAVFSNEGLPQSQKQNDRSRPNNGQDKRQDSPDRSPDEVARYVRDT
jgi:hypothetical protein